VAEGIEVKESRSDTEAFKFQRQRKAKGKNLSNPPVGVIKFTGGM
jgi:hypothetical protein